MEKQELIELITKHDRTVGAPGPDCPDCDELVAFLYGLDERDARVTFRAHLDECRYCMARLGIVAQSQQFDDTEAIEHDLLAQAIRFGHPNAKGRFRMQQRWVAAAVLAVIVLSSAFFLADSYTKPFSSSVPSEAPDRSMRNLDAGTLRTLIIAPLNGSEVAMEPMRIQWTGVAGSLYYDLRLVDDQGFVIWEGRVDATEYTLALDELNLETGQRYFVRVDAYLAESKSIGSPHVGFIVRAPSP